MARSIEISQHDRFHTLGTLSACAEAASVVTVLFARVILEMALLRKGTTDLAFNALENIVVVVGYEL